MFSRKEASALRQQFWTAFGMYMQPIPGAEGEKVNWVNYKTGEKDVSFRMQAESTGATIAIEVAHKDETLQALYFETFRQWKSLFEETLEEEWEWSPQVENEGGKIVSLIYTELPDANVFRRDDWPQLISFFKPRIIALDAFWSQVKYGFEALR